MRKLFYDNTIATIEQGIIYNLRSDTEGTFLTILFLDHSTGLEEELEIKVVRSSVILDVFGRQASRNILRVGKMAKVIVSASILHGYKAQYIHLLS